MTKNRTSPITIFEALASNALHLSATWEVPLSRKITNTEMTTISPVLNFASHATIIAVNPYPPAVLEEEIEWSCPATVIIPQTPQIIPERAIVRIITVFTLIPAYSAVRSDSPTTEISYPCFVLDK